MADAQTHADSTLPLAGIRVLEFCHAIMGPSAGLILADLGADVIKIEPVAGDTTRRLVGFAAGFFGTFNRNKRSVAIDLKADAGRTLLHRLAATADVVVENYAPGTMDRLGCGYADLSKTNPRLIYCALKGFLSGPYEHRPALDEVVQFMAGLAYMTGPPGQPLRAGSSVVDIMGGMFAVIGVQAALRERERTGRGQLIKSALFETTAFLMAQHMAGQAVTGRPPPPMPAREGAWGIYDPFETAGGEQIFVGLTSDRQWRRFCEHFARHDLLQNPAYKTNEDRVRERPVLRPVVAAIVARHTLAELVELFDRIDIPFAPVAKPGDLFDDPQLNAGGRMLDVVFADGVPRQNSAAAGRNRRSRSGAAPPGAGDRRAHRRSFGRARAHGKRDRRVAVNARIVAVGGPTMSDLPKRVHISEEGPREGFQFEKGAIPTARKIALIDALAQTGIDQIQIVSFVNPKAVPGMADAEDVVHGITPKPDVAYTALWLNDKGFERALREDRLTLKGTIQLCTSEKFLMRNQNRTMAQQLAGQHTIVEMYKASGVPVERGSLMAAFGCNFEGDVPVSRVVSLVGQILDVAKEHGVTLTYVTLADTMAWATPLAIKRVVGALRERWPDLDIALHLHDTRGMAIANAYAGLEMGVTRFDSSVAGLGGCPFAGHKGAAGNVCTEDLVFMCNEIGIETGIDLDALIECAKLAEDVVGHPLPGSVMKGGDLQKYRA